MIIRWQRPEVLVTSRAVVAWRPGPVDPRITAERRPALDQPRVKRLVPKTVGSLAERTATVVGHWRPVGPVQARTGLALDPLGDAGMCRTRRRRPYRWHAPLIRLVAEFDWRLPRGRIVRARRAAMVFMQPRPARWRLLVTKPVLPIGGEQVLAVVGPLVPAVSAILIRSVFGAGSPELVCSRPAGLLGTRVTELIGAGITELIGASVTELIGARAAELIRTGARELIGTGARELIRMVARELIAPVVAP